MGLISFQVEHLAYFSTTRYYIYELKQISDGTGQLVLTNTNLAGQMQNGLSFNPYNGQPFAGNTTNSASLLFSCINLSLVWNVNS